MAYTRTPKKLIGATWGAAIITAFAWYAVARDGQVWSSSWPWLVMMTACTTIAFVGTLRGWRI